MAALGKTPKITGVHKSKKRNHFKYIEFYLIVLTFIEFSFIGIFKARVVLRGLGKGKIGYLLTRYLNIN